MKKSLFITGITGFMGTNLLQRLDFSLYEHVYGVGRTENDKIKALLKRPNFTFVKADILQTDDYIQYLNSSDIVIHMAALTGKASREDYFQINRDGTQLLLENCRKANIDRFIFISSIAANFKNIKYYYYAQSKIAAEEDIKKSTIPYTIIRPTIVIGIGSPILLSFKKMVEMPIVPIFGDGKTKIQPIFIADLTNCLLHVINQEKFINETIEIGGPQKIRIEDFIKRFHFLIKKRQCRSIHLPISILASLLAFLEKYFLRFLPFTAGQLASFSNSGIAKNNTILEKTKMVQVGIDEMLLYSLEMNETDVSGENAVKRECRILAHYLIGTHADAYAQNKYIQGHKKINMEPSDRFIDQFLLKKAVNSPFWLRLADMYSSIFFPQATLRKKLLLMIAILECQPYGYAALDSVAKKSTLRLLFELGQKGISFLIILFISMILIGPFHAASMFGKRSLLDKQVS